MKWKATNEQKQRARLILRGAEQAQAWMDRGNYDEAEYISKMILADARELLRDVELSNLERWWNR